jgi:hypothetical protein
MLLVNGTLLVLVIVNPETVTDSAVGLAWAVLVPFVGLFLTREAMRAHRELRDTDER